MTYKVENFRVLIAYQKSLRIYKEIHNDINGLSIKDNCSIRKKAGKVASIIARAIGSAYYPGQQIYHYKQAIFYTYQLEKEIERCKVKNCEEHILKLIEIRKLVHSYIKRIN